VVDHLTRRWRGAIWRCVVCLFDQHGSGQRRRRPDCLLVGWVYERASRQKDPTDEFRTANANVSGELSDAECRIAKSEVGGWPEDRWDYAVTNALDKLEAANTIMLSEGRVHLM
jgi:hypothetical protein